MSVHARTNVSFHPCYKRTRQTSVLLSWTDRTEMVSLQSGFHPQGHTTIEGSQKRLHSTESSFMDATKVSSSNIHPRGHSWPLIIKTNGWVMLAFVRGAQKEKRVVRATVDDEGEEEENSARVLERATIMATSSTATAVRRLATKLAPSSTITVSGMLVFFFLRGKRFLLCT